MRLGVFAVNGVGDHLMMWPALRALHCLSGGDLTLFSDTTVTASLYGDLRPMESVHIECSRDGNGVRQFDVDAFFCAARAFDHFISLNSWTSSSEEALLSRLTVPAYGFFAAFANTVGVEGLNAFDAYFRIAQSLGYAGPIDSCAQPPVFDGVDAKNVLAQLGLDPRRKLLIIHPETESTKDWAEDSLNEFLRLFSMRYPEWNVALVHLFADRYRRFSPRRHQVRVCAAPLENVGALISSAAVFLGCDSCMLHLADLARVPCVALFRSTSTDTWGCRFTRRRYVWLDRETGTAPLAGIFDAITSLQSS